MSELRKATKREFHRFTMKQTLRVEKGGNIYTIQWREFFNAKGELVARSIYGMGRPAYQIIDQGKSA